MGAVYMVQIIGRPRWFVGPWRLIIQIIYRGFVASWKLSRNDGDAGCRRLVLGFTTQDRPHLLS
jgi:hypothetical protein